MRHKPGLFSNFSLRKEDPFIFRLFFLLFSLEDNCFTMLCWFLPYINMNQLRVYTRPLPREPLSHFPVHPTLLGCLRPQGSGSLHHTENPPWLSISYKIMHMFPSCSLSSSHSLLPLLCSQICSLCFHFYSYHANRFIIVIFIDSIYMC